MHYPGVESGSEGRCIGGTGPEGQCSGERGPGVFRQGVRVVAEALGGLETGQGDLAGEDGGGFVGSASNKQFAQLVAELLHLHGVAVAQFRVLLDQREVARVARVRGVLETALRSRNSMPLADWLQLTWLRLGAADAYPVQDLQHARAFFAALSERAAGGEWSGPQDLESLLGDLFAQPQTTAPNPVQLMTIHRAKGLEFDHVFVPCLERELNRGREPLLDRKSVV